MTAQNKETLEILHRAEEILSTAKLGFEDLLSNNKVRKFSGLRNLIVFGRSVTFVLQNLRSVEDEFESWYAEIQSNLSSDPLMKYFVEVRNNILKQGKMNTSNSTYIRTFSGDDIKKMGTPPPGATAFFIGDEIGGSGWRITLPNGEEEKYYVDLPSSIGEAKIVFPDLPESVDANLRGKSINELCSIYLETLEKILNSARKKFLNDDSKIVNGKKLPPYIKVIK